MDLILAEDVVRMLGLNEAIGLLTEAKSVSWNWRVLRRENGDALRMVFCVEMGSQRLKGRVKGVGKH